MLDVEDREPHHQAGVRAPVGDRRAQVRDPGADALSHRPAVQAIGGGAGLQGLEQPLGLGDAPFEAFAGRRPLERRSEPAPAVDQLPGGRVQLPVGAVLG